MKKRKWVYIILIILLALPVLFFYDAFNGNPLSKRLSKSTLKSYLAATYPEDEFRLSKPIYNFKDNGYDYDVRKVGDFSQTDYQFIVTGLFGSNVHYDAIYYENQDTQLIEKLEQQASDELTALLQKEVPEILQVTPQLEVLKGTYDADTQWTKDFKAEKPMYIHIVVDTRELSKEAILQIAKTIQKTLNVNGYAYNHTMINANILSDDKEEDKDSFGYVKYAISFEKDTKLKLKQVTQYND